MSDDAGLAANARRTIEKSEIVLERCLEFFGHQARMNAAAHLSDKVMYPPIHSSIQSALNGIHNFQATYPREPESEIL